MLRNICQKTNNFIIFKLPIYHSQINCSIIIQLLIIILKGFNTAQKCYLVQSMEILNSTEKIAQIQKTIYIAQKCSIQNQAIIHSFSNTAHGTELSKIQ